MEGELNDYVLLFSLGSAGILIILAKYIWSRWWKAEASVQRGWLFIKTWGGTNYIELLPKKIELINDLTLKVIGDPWRSYTQGLIIRFNLPNDASIIYSSLKKSTKK